MWFVLYAELPHVKARLRDACCFRTRSKDILYAGCIVIGAYPTNLTEEAVQSSNKKKQ